MLGGGMLRRHGMSLTTLSVEHPPTCVGIQIVFAQPALRVRDVFEQCQRRATPDAGE
jgi:hypothetical protein